MTVTSNISLSLFLLALALAPVVELAEVLAALLSVECLLDAALVLICNELLVPPLAVVDPAMWLDCWMRPGISVAFDYSFFLFPAFIAISPLL